MSPGEACVDTQGPLMAAFTSTTELRTVPGLGKASPTRRWWLPRFTGEHAEVWALEEVVVRGLEMRLGRQGGGSQSVLPGSAACRCALLNHAAWPGPWLQQDAPPPPTPGCQALASCSRSSRPPAEAHLQKRSRIMRVCGDPQIWKRSRQPDALQRERPGAAGGVGRAEQPFFVRFSLNHETSPGSESGRVIKLLRGPPSWLTSL